MKENMGRKQRVSGGRGYVFIACAIIMPLLVCGCSQFQARSTFREANDFFSQGNFRASLGAYERIVEQYPQEADRALFEMGIIYAHPKNEQKDYQKSLGCFQKIMKEYPESRYRHESERMIFHLSTLTMKDAKITSQQAQIASLQREVKSREAELGALREKVEALEQASSRVVKGPADKILIEKKKRRLTLISNGTIIKTYKIALGGNPVGPKTRQGDNKTPEGTYIIDSRDKSSRYHMSLHISYPNRRDMKRARRLGVSPGGDIMIHGIKDGFSAIGELHTGADWTKGCIAVTDEEIEEIEKLVPNGTIVVIRP